MKLQNSVTKGAWEQDRAPRWSGAKLRGSSGQVKEGDSLHSRGDWEENERTNGGSASFCTTTSPLVALSRLHILHMKGHDELANIPLSLSVKSCQHYNLRGIQVAYTGLVRNPSYIFQVRNDFPALLFSTTLTLILSLHLEWECRIGCRCRTRRM